MVTTNHQLPTTNSVFRSGTSGFSYPEWKGAFYPAGVAADGMLRYYASVFPTVEINNSFYRYPKDDTLAQWAAAVPAGFRFSIKAHRRITHNKRLKDTDTDVAFLYERVLTLGPQMGPLLFQLPPSLRADPGVLEAFLAQLRPGPPVAIEFRHASWSSDAVYALLDRYRVSLCVAETDEPAAPTAVVGPIAYLRLHKSRYDDDALRSWAEWITERLAEGRDAYAYFTHEEGAPATDYAQKLTKLVNIESDARC
ncbi:MAG TPA: DUF72 domain-containing protein [bacterium]|jgi:uncharacterized protein YecE (DUF72 family)